MMLQWKQRWKIEQATPRISEIAGQTVFPVIQTSAPKERKTSRRDKKKNSRRDKKKNSRRDKKNTNHPNKGRLGVVGPHSKLRNAPSTAGNSMASSERPFPEPLLKKEASPAVLGGERILEMLWKPQMPWFPITVLKVILINFPKITVTVTVLKCFWIRKVIISNMTVLPYFYRGFTRAEKGQKSPTQVVRKFCANGKGPKRGKIVHTNFSRLHPQVDSDIGHQEDYFPCFYHSSRHNFMKKAHDETGLKRAGDTIGPQSHVSHSGLARNAPLERGTKNANLKSRHTKKTCKKWRRTT